MNKRKLTFAEHMIALTMVLFTGLFVETIFLFIVLRKYAYSGLQHKIYIFMLLTAVFFVICLVFYHYVLALYRKCLKLFRKFIKGDTYKDLLENNYQVFPEMKTVLEHFDKLLDKQKVIKLSTKQAEFLALQNQINPHFLYNTLEAIRGDALCAGLDNIAEITEALSTFFRYTISETGNLVALEDELENIENYIMIQRYRFGEKLKMEVRLPEGENHVLRFQVPKLTLQPLIENAVFHGLECKADGGTITVDVETTPDKLLISVRDDGVGIPEEKLDKINKKLNLVSVDYISENKKKKESIALYNVCRRIKLLFGEEYGIHIFSIEGVGTDVRINIPIIEEQKGI